MIHDGGNFVVVNLMRLILRGVILKGSIRRFREAHFEGCHFVVFERLILKGSFGVILVGSFGVNWKGVNLKGSFGVILRVLI